MFVQEMVPTIARTREFARRIPSSSRARRAFYPIVDHFYAPGVEQNVDDNVWT